LLAKVEFTVQPGDPPATVYVNGRAIGTTPVSGTFDAGTAEVRYAWSDGEGMEGKPDLERWQNVFYESKEAKTNP